MVDHEAMPKHIAIIMDGNGRWAKQRGKSRSYGHRKGHSAVLDIVRHTVSLGGVKSLTLYAFSSENWSRPDDEVSALMALFSHAIKRHRKLFMKHAIRFQVIGDKSAFSEKLQREISILENDTRAHQGLMLNIAANYGAKWDIARASKRLAKQVARGELTPEAIDESRFEQQLCLSDQTAVDLLIRTGGEYRISNYLLWQCAYAEFYFTPTFWPDFDGDALDNAIREYQRRHRRFGGVDPIAE